MKYAKYILILALLAASGACTKDFEDYNTNPNKQSEGSVAPIALLEPLIYSSTNSYSSYMLSIANEISQVTVAKSTPRREHCYNLADGNFKAIWNLGYKWAGNAKHMYDLAVAQNQPNFQAIGLTLKVYNMSILTDMFGSIAYREALKGGEGINTPHIDSQQEVYTAMLEELELANSLYNASLGLDDPTKDGIYGGDIAKWQKFTNTLRLRLLMRVSGRNNAFTPTVGEQINQIISNPGKYPVFESNDDNATVKFSGSAEYYKTYFNSSSFPDDKSLSSDHHIAAQLLDLLYDASDGFVDPRLRIWIKPRYVQYPSATEPDQLQRHHLHQRTRTLPALRNAGGRHAPQPHARLRRAALHQGRSSDERLDIGLRQGVLRSGDHRVVPEMGRIRHLRLLPRTQRVEQDRTENRSHHAEEHRLTAGERPRKME